MWYSVFKIDCSQIVKKIMNPKPSLYSFSFRNLFISFLLLFLLSPNTVLAEALNLPKDASGWTSFTPSTDTRIMYVSPTGNDSTGKVYEATNSAIGDNPFEPSGVIGAFKTYEAAYSNTREGYPDWVLFKRGETYYEAIGTRVRSGRSASEPFLIGAYGTSGLSPLLKVGSSAALTIWRVSPSQIGTLEFVSVQGIHFYAHTRNPDDDEYLNSDGSNGLTIHANLEGNVVKNILIEGCSFNFFKNNTLQATQGAVRVSNVVIRRSSFLNSYSTTSHAQGLYAYLIDNVILEENIFDHNGWLIESYNSGTTGGQATIFNHNIYFASVNNTTFRKNIFMRPSSIHTKFTAEYRIENLTVENNLYLDGEIAFDGCNNYRDNEYRIYNATIKNNVMQDIGKSNPTGRGVSWGIRIQGFDVGDVENNLFLNQSMSYSNSFFLSIQDQTRGLNVSNNIAFMADNSEFSILLLEDGVGEDIEIQNTYIEAQNEKTYFVYSFPSISGYSFTGNEYSSNSNNFRVQSTTYSASQWLNNIETSATFNQRSFPDPNRRIETYNQLAGGSATLEDFIAKVNQQDRYNWDTIYTADSVNEWIRAGYFETVDGNQSIVKAPNNLQIIQ